MRNPIGLTLTYHAAGVHDAVSEGVGVVSAQSVDRPVIGPEVGVVSAPNTTAHL